MCTAVPVCVDNIDTVAHSRHFLVAVSWCLVVRPLRAGCTIILAGLSTPERFLRRSGAQKMCRLAADRWMPCRLYLCLGAKRYRMAAF